MTKKILAVLLSASMAFSLAVIPASAELTEQPVTTILEYNPNLDPADPGYLDITSNDTIKAAGVIKTAAYTGTAGSLIPLQKSGSAKVDSTKKGVSISPNFKDSAEDKVSGYIDFSTRAVENGITLDNANGYLMEMEFGSAMRADAKGGVYKYSLMGTAEGSDTAMPVATMILSSNTSTGSGTRNGQMYMNDANSKKVTYPININGQANPVQLSYLRLYVDMKNQTYSAWLVKRQDGNSAYVEAMPAEAECLVKDAPFETEGITALSKMQFSLKLAYTGDGTYISFLKFSELNDNNIVVAARNALDIAGKDAVASDLTLPLVFQSADVSWTSNKEDVINSQTGKVTRPEYGQGDTTVTLTATLSRGEATDTKDITVTVKEGNVPVPENGVWVEDEMDYTSSAEIPATGLYAITTDSDGNSKVVANPADSISENTGGVYGIGEAGYLTVLKASDSTKSGAIYKYISPSAAQQHVGKQTVEFEYELINNPKELYMAVENYDNWKGPMTFQHDPAAGEFWSFNNNGHAKVGNKVKVTLNFDYTAKKLDIYLNGVLYQSGVAYRNDGYYASAKYDLGKVQFSVDKGSPKGSGVKINYIRVYETEKYGAWNLGKDAETVSAWAASVNKTVADGDTVAFPASQYGNTISWASDSPAINTETGAVTGGLSQATVTLTPTLTNQITKEEQTLTPVIFTVSPVQQVVSDPLTAVTTESGEQGQQAVGFAASYTGDGSDNVQLGMILSYPEKADWKIPFSARLSGNLTAKFGVIVQGDFDPAQMSAKSYAEIAQ